MHAPRPNEKPGLRPIFEHSEIVPPSSSPTNTPHLSMSTDWGQRDRNTATAPTGLSSASDGDRNRRRHNQNLRIPNMTRSSPPSSWRLRLPTLFLLAFTLALPGVVAGQNADASNTWSATSPASEIAAQVAPFPRITHLSAAGQPSPLFQDPAHDRTGIRFLAVERVGNKQRGIAFDAPGTWTERNATSAVMEIKNTDADLTLKVRMKLVEDRVSFDCELTSKQAARKLALWAIASVPNRGWIVLPQSRGLEGGNWIAERICAFFGCGFDDPKLVLGHEAFALNLEAGPATKPLKYGTRAHAGWIAGVRPDLQNLLLIRALYASDDAFPDEDCNITAYVGASPSKIPYSEIEWLSPWSTLDANVPMEWAFTVASVALAPEDNPTPDSLIQAIRDPKIYNAASQQPTDSDVTTWCLTASGPLVKDRFGRATKFFSGPEPDPERPIAQAPLWFDAPVWSAEGLQWHPDTLVEAVRETIPPWEPKGRRWKIRFSPPNVVPENGSALICEGDAESGFAVTLVGNEARALLWNGSNDRCGVVLPLDASGAHEITVELKPGSLSIASEGNPPVVASLKFPIPTPPQRMGIGRVSGWPRSNAPNAPAYFEGAFQEISITPLR